MSTISNMADTGTQLQQSSAVMTIAIATVLLLIAYWLLIKKSAKQILVDKMPGPPALPIIGNAHMFKNNGVDFYYQVNQYCKEFGGQGIWRIWLGSHVLLVITKAEQAEALLNSSKHMTKSLLYAFLMPWLGTGLLTSTGAKWHSRRKLLTPTFHFRILNDFLQVFNEQSTIMIGRLKEQATTGKSFNVTPYITHCALDIICITSMGVNVHAQVDSDSEYVRAIYKISDVIMKRIKFPWLWPDFLFHLFQSGRDHRRCLKILHDFTNEVIKVRSVEMDQQIRDGTAVSLLGLDTASAPGGQDTTPDSLPTGTREGEEEGGDGVRSKRKRLVFMDLLLYASKTSTTTPLTTEDIREEVDTFMFEGHDTTAAATNWIVYMLGAHPEVQQKLRDEVDSIFGDSDRAVTMDDFKEMKYMDCVIKETLRMFPIVPMFAREISEDCNIGGYFVPKGATAIITATSIHFDEKQFPNPDRFEPERWLPGGGREERHPFSFIPFSAGLRNCIGQKFAMMEMRVQISSMLRHFHIKSLQAMSELRPTMELILRPQNGITIELSNRERDNY